MGTLQVTCTKNRCEGEKQTHIATTIGVDVRIITCICLSMALRLSPSITHTLTPVSKSILPALVTNWTACTPTAQP
jgi:hypothetical protein